MTTNEVLVSSTKNTEKVINLSKEPQPKPQHLPSEIIDTLKKKKMLITNYLKKKYDLLPSSDITLGKDEFEETRSLHRRSLRHYASLQQKWDLTLNKIMMQNSKQVFKMVMSLTSKSNNSTSELFVNGKRFIGDNVCDGFFLNVKNLKTLDPELNSCNMCNSFKIDYRIIKEMSKAP